MVTQTGFWTAWPGGAQHRPPSFSSPSFARPSFAATVRRDVPQEDFTARADEDLVVLEQVRTVLAVQVPPASAQMVDRFLKRVEHVKKLSVETVLLDQLHRLHDYRAAAEEDGANGGVDVNQPPVTRTYMNHATNAPPAIRKAFAAILRPLPHDVMRGEAAPVLAVRWENVNPMTSNYLVGFDWQDAAGAAPKTEAGQNELSLTPNGMSPFLAVLTLGDLPDLGDDLACGENVLEQSRRRLETAGWTLPLRVFVYKNGTVGYKFGVDTPILRVDDAAVEDAWMALMVGLHQQVTLQLGA